MMCDETSTAMPQASNTRTRAIRFLGTGVVNTMFGYGVYALLVSLGAHVQVALVAQFALGVIWNYALHARFVFGVSGYDKLPRYCLAYVSTYLFNAVLLQILSNAGMNPYAAQLLALVPTVILSFVLVSYALGASLDVKGGRNERL